VSWCSYLEDIIEALDSRQPVERTGQASLHEPAWEYVSPASAGAITSRHAADEKRDPLARRDYSGRADDLSASRDVSSSLLTGYFYNLRQSLDDARLSISKDYYSGQWKTLSLEMDEVQLEVDRFYARTRFAIDRNALRSAELLEKRIADVNRRAMIVNDALGASLAKLVKELNSVDELKRRSGRELAQHERDAERDAGLLVVGWRQLRAQIDALNDGATRLTEGIAEALLKRATSSPNTRIPDKDADNI
jgi:hypothetical protein